MEPAKGCSICIGSLPGSVKTPWFGLMEGSEIPEEKTAEPSTVRDPTSKFNQPQTQEYRVEMYPGVICSAVHAATRCAFAITTLHPGSNLKNLAYEEGKKRGSLHVTQVKRLSLVTHPEADRVEYLEGNSRRPQKAMVV